MAGALSASALAVREAMRMERGSTQGQQMEMRLGRPFARTSGPALTASQAACIEALRKGAASHSQAAMAAGLSRYEVLDEMRRRRAA